MAEAEPADQYAPAGQPEDEFWSHMRPLQEPIGLHVMVDLPTSHLDAEGDAWLALYSPSDAEMYLGEKEDRGRKQNAKLLFTP